MYVKREKNVIFIKLDVLDFFGYKIKSDAIHMKLLSC